MTDAAAQKAIGIVRAFFDVQIVSWRQAVKTATREMAREQARRKVQEYEDLKNDLLGELARRL